MVEQAFRVLTRPALGLLLAAALAGAAIPLTALGAEVPTVDEIKAHWAKQREKIGSLYIEVKHKQKPSKTLKEKTNPTKEKK